MTDIFCSACDQAFEAYEICGQPIKQAYGCSSELVGDKIQGYYGSTTIDTELWQFVESHPYHDGLICDNCISHLMRLGQIELVEGASGNAMRILVCGGRNFKNKELLEKVLNDFKNANQVDCIIEGNAPGADRMAGYWARKNGIDNLKYPARWDIYGNAAGPIRNQHMLEDSKPDYVIAFKGGKGTQDMIARALKANIIVETFE